MVDVTIKGAGIFGLSIAWACLTRGSQVRVVDPYGVGAGSSGGIVGALAPHTPENWNDKKAFQFESLAMAERYWAQVDAVSGLSSGYGRTGRLQPVSDARGLELAQQRAKSAESLWEGQFTWRVIPAVDAGDWAPRSATGYLIHDTLTARMHPRQACASLAAAIQAKGGDIQTEAEDAGLIVDATGWNGLTQLSDEVGYPIGNGVKGQAALLAWDAREAPQLFADALHIVPHADGTVAIGSTSEREFDEPTTTDDQLEDVIARARSAFPVLEQAKVIERWAGVRPRARSRAPMLGAHPTRKETYVANGGFKIGFGMAPKIGEVMANLLLDGTDTIPPDFRVDANFRK